MWKAKEREERIMLYTLFKAKQTIKKKIKVENVTMST